MSVAAPSFVSEPDSKPLLSLENVSIAFPGTKGAMDRVTDGVSLSVRRGEVVGVVGESGSGKSMTALSVLGLIPEPGRVVQGKIILDGTDVLSLTEKQKQHMRGGVAAMIFQDPMTSLNPVFTVGEQIAEAVRLHRDIRDKKGAFAEAVDALRRVQIPSPERRAAQYPHELSGGMRQRVMIAMALACRPALLLADEPTTALDVTVQAQILSLINKLRTEEGMAVLLITHDLGVVAETCDRVIVLYAGQVMETTDAHTLFARPSHPYTQGLLASLPESIPEGATRLPYIKGQPPANASAIAGCPFRPRCPEAVPGLCEQPLPTVTLAPGHIVRCHLRVTDEVRQ
ncbi:MAG: ABC transporter ATP-binding protein [Akkermansiaceae bacterium]|nr:ABC transporter ATP-binding protein [Armatimonadota bacterium]